VRQDTVDKVVVVIKDRLDTPLERFVFSIRKMIEVEAYSKDDRCASRTWRAERSADAF
jgi:hypothetical protein